MDCSDVGVNIRTQHELIWDLINLANDTNEVQFNKRKKGNELKNKKRS